MNAMENLFLLPLYKTLGRWWVQMKEQYHFMLQQQDFTQESQYYKL